MKTYSAVVLSLLGLASAQSVTLGLPTEVSSIISDIEGGATQATGAIGGGIDQATSAIRSEISSISNALTTAQGSASNSLNSALTSASNLLSSLSTTSTDDGGAAPYQTAAVGLGALFGGAAVLANF